MGPGRLQTINRPLYVSLGFELARRNPPLSIGEYFAELSDGKTLTTPFQRRFRACAEILATDEREAARFLTNIRVPRIKNVVDDEPSALIRKTDGLGR